MNDIKSELEFRASKGNYPCTRKTVMSELAKIGYRLGEGVPSQNRYVTGDRAGHSYPAVNFDVVEIDSGRSAYSAESRRDKNFAALQSLRFNESLFYAARGRICEI